MGSQIRYSYSQRTHQLLESTRLQPQFDFQLFQRLHCWGLFDEKLTPIESDMSEAGLTREVSELWVSNHPPESLVGRSLPLGVWQQCPV